jgi:hypothetical protein
MPIFIIVPSLVLMFLASLVFGSFIYLSKDPLSSWSYKRPTLFEKAWFVSNLIVLSFFF